MDSPDIDTQQVIEHNATSGDHLRWQADLDRALAAPHAREYPVIFVCLVITVACVATGVVALTLAPG